MSIRFATPAEISDWNQHILSNPDGGNILQGNEFAELKQHAGWKIRYIVADKLAVTALEKNIPALGNVWYIPKGPGVITALSLKKLLPSLKKFAHEHGVFTIKIEPEIPGGTSLEHLGLTRTRPIQYNWATVYVNLEPSLETILKNLPQKGRHAIRRAERDGVTVKQVPASNENCKIMFNLLKDTAAGAEFGIRPAAYYKTFYQNYEKAGLGQLFFAYYEGVLVAGAYAVVFGKRSTYKDGASIRKRTAYGASHLLQWHVITWAKQQGSLQHDLCGSPPISESKNPHHPFYGIGLFKTSFNKEITEYVGAYEIPVRPLKSKLWTHFLEKVVRRIYYKIYHESFY